jgi:hypothetical protein
VGIAAVAIVESLAAPLPLAPVPDLRLLAMVPANGATLLDVPFGIRDGFGERGMQQAEALYGQTQYGYALVGGFIARGPRRIWNWYETTEPYATLLQLSEGDVGDRRPSCEQVIGGLAAAHVTHVLFTPERSPAALAAFVTDRMPLQRIADDGHRVLFEVDETRCGVR